MKKLVTSDCLIITGAQGGHEKKRSFIGHQEPLLHRLSSGSSSYESLPNEVSLKKSCDLFIGSH